MKNTPESRCKVLNNFFNQKIQFYEDIVVFKNGLLEDELKALNKNFSSVSPWVGVESSDKKIVNETTKLHYIVDPITDKYLFQITNKIFKTYSVLYPEAHLLIKSDQRYRYNWYKVNEGYFNHVDCSSLNEFYRERLLSCILQLNSDYDGGILYFPNQDFKIKLEAGDVILFPSIHTHPHSVSPITSGERKNIVTWFI